MPNDLDGKPPCPKLSKKELGALAERRAVRYLEGKKYKILALNYRLRNGEIDIIAQDGAYIAFIEVKYRKDLRYGYPREAVNFRKQSTIRTVALHFIATRNLHGFDFRFDVIEIIKGMDITHIENAF